MRRANTHHTQPHPNDHLFPRGVRKRNHGNTRVSSILYRSQLAPSSSKQPVRQVSQLVPTLMARELGFPGTCGPYSGRRISAVQDLRIHNRTKFSGVFDLRDISAAPQIMRDRLNAESFKVVEIICAEEFLFGLTACGICHVFNRITKKRLGVLNVPSSDQLIRSLFYNKTCQSIITVSVHQDDRYSCLKCFSITLDAIRRKAFDERSPLFAGEVLSWPGFVEFDELNQKVMTCSPRPNRVCVFKIWEMCSFNLLFELEDVNIQEMKISPDVLLVIQKKTRAHLPLRILDITTGKTIQELPVMLKNHSKLDLLELFSENLLVKQEGEPLRIINLNGGEEISVPCSEFSNPSSFMFLYDKQMFIACHERRLSVWNFKGQLVTSFDDHELFSAPVNNNNMIIPKSQDLIISFCANKRGVLDDSPTQGSINISSLVTGQLLHKIVPEQVTNLFTGESRRSHPLEDVTAMYYEEFSQEIYTGTADGHINLWC